VPSEQSAVLIRGVVQYIDAILTLGILHAALLIIGLVIIKDRPRRSSFDLFAPPPSKRNFHFSGTSGSFGQTFDLYLRMGAEI
jgi:hypothetical protein